MQLGNHFVVGGNITLHDKGRNSGNFCGQSRNAWNAVSEMVMAVWICSMLKLWSLEKKKNCLNSEEELICTLAVVSTL